MFSAIFSSHSTLISLAILILVIIVGYLVLKELKNVRQQVKTQKAQIRKMKQEILHGYIQSDMTAVDYHPQLEPPAEPFFTQQSIPPIRQPTPDSPTTEVDNNQAPAEAVGSSTEPATSTTPDPEPSIIDSPRSEEVNDDVSPVVEQQDESSEPQDDNLISDEYVLDSSHMPSPDQFFVEEENIQEEVLAEDIASLSSDGESNPVKVTFKSPPGKRPALRLQFKKKE